MKYLISGRNIKITAVPESATTTRRKTLAKTRQRDSEGRFLANGSKPVKGKKQPWMRLLVLAKPMK